MGVTAWPTPALTPVANASVSWPRDLEPVMKGQSSTNRRALRIVPHGDPNDVRLWRESELRGCSAWSERPLLPMRPNRDGSAAGSGPRGRSARPCRPGPFPTTLSASVRRCTGERLRRRTCWRIRHARADGVHVGPFSVARSLEVALFTARRSHVRAHSRRHHRRRHRRIDLSRGAALTLSRRRAITGEAGPCLEHRALDVAVHGSPRRRRPPAGRRAGRRRGPRCRARRRSLGSRVAASLRRERLDDRVIQRVSRPSRAPRRRLGMLICPDERFSGTSKPHSNLAPQGGACRFVLCEGPSTG